MHGQARRVDAPSKATRLAARSDVEDDVGRWDRDPLDTQQEDRVRSSLAVRVVENVVVVPATRRAVWDRVVQPDGINHEMRPWMTMTMPRSASGLTIASVPLDRPLGRAWIRLFGLVPFDYDHLTLVELDVGRRFLERSTMLSMRRGEHERTLRCARGGTRVHDRVAFEPRLPSTAAAALLAVLIDAFLKHRQRRLRAWFSGARR